MEAFIPKECGTVRLFPAVICVKLDLLRGLISIGLKTFAGPVIDGFQSVTEYITMRGIKRTLMPWNLKPITQRKKLTKLPK